MPETFEEKINRILRDHEGYDGNGGTGALPVGDRSTAQRPISKRDLREALKGFADVDGNASDAILARDVAIEVSQNPEDAPVSIGGFSALHHSAKASAAQAGSEAAAAAAASDRVLSQAAAANAQSSARNYKEWDDGSGGGAVNGTYVDDGTGVEVIDADTGSHFAATATGYDGAPTPNAGKYQYNAAWGRLVRIGGTGLSDKPSYSDVAATLSLLFDEPNLWPDPDWLKIVGNGQSNEDPSGYFYVNPNANVSNSQQPNGSWNLSITSTDASEARVLWRQYIAALGLQVGDEVTVSVNVVSRSGASGTGATRLILFRYDAAGAEIARSTQTIAPGVSGRISVTAASLESGTDRIAIWLSSANTSVTLVVQNMLISRTGISTFRASAAPYIARVSGPHASWVAPDGVDSDRRDGSSLRPYRTPNFALQRMRGHGIIRLPFDRADYGAEMQIDPALISGTLEMRGEAGLDGGSTGYKQPPLITLASPLAAATLYDSPVYRTVTTLGATPNFVWLDAVNDADSAIGSERRPEHRGRDYRLKSTRILGLSEEASLAAAVVTMKASGMPQCYVDGGYLYFTVPAGVDATTANIYTSSDQGLVQSRTVRSGGRLILRGLETRYGIVNLRGCSSAHLEDFEALGSPSDLIRYSHLTCRMVYLAGCGETSGDLGDIVSGHGGAYFGFQDFYGAYARDDCVSWHEDCLGYFQGGLIERCGGSAVAIAVGGRAKVTGVRSFENQQNPGRKAAAFLATGIPADGSPVGDGTGTMVEFELCESEADTVGFSADSTANVVCRAKRCITIGATTAGYDRVTAEDCADRGSAAASTGNTTILQSTLLS